MKIPQIKPHFRVEIIEPKNVYLLSESATYALTGSLYCQILPLLNGQYTLAEIIQQLEGQVPADHLHYVLDRLQEKATSPMPLTHSLLKLPPFGVHWVSSRWTLRQSCPQFTSPLPLWVSLIPNR